MSIFAYLRSLITDDDGCVATEYVFLIAFLCIAVFFAAQIYGEALLNFFSVLANNLALQPTAMPSSPSS